MAQIITGAQFSSYDDFVQALEKFESDTGTQFSIADSRTLDSAQKRVPRIVEITDPTIRYYSITLKCYKTGEYKPKGKGIRPNQKTQKTCCPAVIKLKVNRNGKLEIFVVNNEHCHENDPTVLPKQRQQSVDEKPKVKPSLRVKVNQNATPRVECVFSEHEKYKNTFKIAYDLASCIVEFAGEDYFRRFKQLEVLKNTWLNGQHVQITLVSEVKDSELEESDGEESNQEEHNSCKKARTPPYSGDGQVLSSTMSCNLKDILPPLKKRQHQKDCENAIIGLPEKKLRKGPVAFTELLPRDKEVRILSWLVPLSDKMLNEILEGNMIIDKDYLTVRPEEMPNCVLDENICVNTVQKYFSLDAWLLVKNLLNVKKQKLKWFCRVCTLVIDDDNETLQSICCDSCLDWIHLKCATLKTFPKNKQWFCSKC